MEIYILRLSAHMCEWVLWISRIHQRWRTPLCIVEAVRLRSLGSVQISTELIGYVRFGPRSCWIINWFMSHRISQQRETEAEDFVGFWSKHPVLVAGFLIHPWKRFHTIVFKKLKRKLSPLNMDVHTFWNAAWSCYGSLLKVRNLGPYNVPNWILCHVTSRRCICSFQENESILISTDCIERSLSCLASTAVMKSAYFWLFKNGW